MQLTDKWGYSTLERELNKRIHKVQLYEFTVLLNYLSDGSLIKYAMKGKKPVAFDERLADELLERMNK